MVTTLPANVEDYTPLQAQSTYSDAEKAAFGELQKYISEHTNVNIWWFWDLGQKVARIRRDAKSQQALYGKKVLFRLAKGLGHNNDRQLYNAMNVVTQFGSKKAFTEYVKLRGEAGNQLSWSHIVYLSGVGDTDLRMQLAAASLEQTWSAEELWRKVKELCDRKARGTRVPDIKIPNSAQGCLTHVSSQAEKYVYNHDKAWTGDAFDLAATVKDIPADKLSIKLLDAVRETKKRVDGMQTRAATMVQILSDIEVDISARMDAQVRLDVAAAAAMSAASGTDGGDDAVAVVAHEKKAAAKKKPAKKKPAKKRPGRVGTSK